MRRVLLAGALLLLAGRARTLTFQQEIVGSQPPPNPWTKGLADLDGDGRLDLIICCGPGLVWYRNPDWTRFTAAANTGIEATNDVEVGDVDGNGSPDIVSANGHWFANPRPAGSAQSSWGAARPFDPSHGHDVSLVDLDGDGDLDVAKRFQGNPGNEIRISRHDGGDSWQHRSIAIPIGEGLGAADLDGDDDVDLVISGRWYENDGDPIGGDWTEHVYADEFDFPNVIVRIGYVDADDIPDVALTPSEGDQSYRISWFEGREVPQDGFFAEHVVAEPVETVQHSLVLADFDRNGRTDLATAEMHSSDDPDQVRVFLQMQGGVFVPQTLSNEGSHSMQGGDLDGDGDVDLFGANWETASAPDGCAVKIWRNGPAPSGPALLAAGALALGAAARARRPR